MGTFASDKYALGECARCGVKMLLKYMLNDGYYPNLIVCPTCWEPRHPQESLPNVEDPTVLYRPAPENLPAPSDVDVTATGGGGGETGVMYVLASAPAVQWQVSDDGVSWRVISQVRDANNIYHYRNLQRWLAVGDGIWISDDGENWTQVVVGDNWLAAAYAPILGVNNIGRIVAVSEGGSVRYSDDGGETWTAATDFNLVGPTPTTLDECFGITWAQEAELFVFNAIAASGVIVTLQTSSNGINWLPGDPQPWFSFDIDFASDNIDRYVALQLASAANVVSTGGITWGPGVFLPGTNENSIDFGLGLFMVCGRNGAQVCVETSPDGTVNWTLTNLGILATIGAPIEVRCDQTRNQWWLVTDTRLHRSTNAAGTAWTEVLSGGTAHTCLGVRDLVDPP